MIPYHSFSIHLPLKSKRIFPFRAKSDINSLRKRSSLLLLRRNRKDQHKKIPLFLKCLFNLCMFQVPSRTSRVLMVSSSGERQGMRQFYWRVHSKSPKEHDILACCLKYTKRLYLRTIKAQYFSRCWPFTSAVMPCKSLDSSNTNKTSANLIWYLIYNQKHPPHSTHLLLTVSNQTIYSGLFVLQWNLIHWVTFFNPSTPSRKEF